MDEEILKSIKKVIDILNENKEDEDVKKILNNIEKILFDKQNENE